MEGGPGDLEKYSSVIFYCSFHWKPQISFTHPPPHDFFTPIKDTWSPKH